MRVMLAHMVRGFLLPVAIMAAVTLAAYVAGYSHGSAKCSADTAKTTGAAAAAEVKRAATKQARATSTGNAREADRAAIDHVFTSLAQEAAHEAAADPATDAACVLPAGRLRIWAAANAGTAHSGTAAAEPDDGAATIAAAGIGPPGRPGSEPLGSGAPLPPAGQPDVPAAGLSGTAHADGLRALRDTAHHPLTAEVAP